MSKHKKAPSSKQQKITSMLTVGHEKNANSDSVVCRQQKKNKTSFATAENSNGAVGNKDVFDFSDEDECNLPISYENFVKYTNINEVAVETIKDMFKQGKKDSTKLDELLRNERYIRKYTKAFHKIFYTRPDYRRDGFLSILRLNENAPARVSKKFYEVPVKYIHRIKDMGTIKKVPKITVNDIWEADCQDPQPSTSSRTVALFQKSAPELDLIKSRVMLAKSLLKNHRIYKNEAIQDFPVDMETFQRLCNMDNIINDIMSAATHDDPSTYEVLKNNTVVRERIFRNYYYAFYDDPEQTRSLFPISLKAAPSLIKKKILSLPSSNRDSSTGAELLAAEVCQDICIEKSKSDINFSQLKSPQSKSVVPDTAIDSSLNASSSIPIPTSETNHISGEELLDDECTANVEEPNNVSAECVKRTENKKRSLSADKDLKNFTKRPKIVQMKLNDDDEEEVEDASTLDITCYENQQTQKSDISKEVLNASQSEIEQNDEHMEDSVACNKSINQNDTDTSNLDIISDEIAEEVNSSFISILQNCEVPKNLKDAEKDFPVTFKEFLENTNVLWLLKEKMTFACGSKENIQLCMKALAFKWYMKFYTDPKFREHKMMEYFYLRFQMARNLQQFPKNQNIAFDNNSNANLTSECLNPLPDDVGNVVTEEIFLKPVENLNIYEKAFPLSFKQFKESIMVEKSLDKIIKQLAKNDERQISIIQQNEELCERIMINCYVQFYTNRMFASEFFVHVQEKKSPLSEEKEEVQFTEPDLENSKITTDKCDKFCEIRNKQHDDVEKQIDLKELLNEKSILPDEFLQRYIQEKINSEVEGRLMKTIELIKPNSQKLEIQSVEVIRPAANPNCNAKEIYFQQVKKDHKLAYLLKSCTGNKQRILSAILKMTFDQFLTYTHIYQGEEMYKDKPLLRRCYKYTIVEKLIWPSNLYINLHDLIKYLNINCKHLSDLKLDDISPILLHYTDLKTSTDFAELASKHYCFQLNQLTAVDVQKYCDKFYKRCWLTNSWVERTPQIKDNNILKEMHKFKLSAEENERFKEVLDTWCFGDNLQKQLEEQNIVSDESEVKDLKSSVNSKEKEANQRNPSTQEPPKSQTNKQQTQILNQEKEEQTPTRSSQQSSHANRKSLQKTLTQEPQKTPTNKQQNQVLNQEDVQTPVISQQQSYDNRKTLQKTSIQEPPKTLTIKLQNKLSNQEKVQTPVISQQQSYANRKTLQKPLNQDQPKTPTNKQQNQVLNQEKVQTPTPNRKSLQKTLNQELLTKLNQSAEPNKKDKISGTPLPFQIVKLPSAIKPEKRKTLENKEINKKNGENNQNDYLPMVSINTSCLEFLSKKAKIIAVESLPSNKTNNMVPQINEDSQEKGVQHVFKIENQLTQNITLSGSTNETNNNTSSISSIPSNVPCSTQQNLISASPNVFGSSGSTNEIECSKDEQQHDQPQEQERQNSGELTEYILQYVPLASNEKNVLNISRDPLSTQNVLESLNSGEREFLQNFSSAIKQEPISPLKNLQFSFHDNSELFINIRSHCLDDIIEVVDEDENLLDALLLTQNNENIIETLSMQSQEVRVNTCTTSTQNMHEGMEEAQRLPSFPNSLGSISLAKSPELLENIEETLEQPQLHKKQATLPCTDATPPRNIVPNVQASNVTLRKKSRFPLPKTKNPDFAPQLTHEFRPLPTRAVTRTDAGATSKKVTPTKNNRQSTCSMSQDLSNDLTIFNNTKLMQIIDQQRNIVTKKTGIPKGERKSPRKISQVVSKVNLLKITKQLEGKQVNKNNHENCLNNVTLKDNMIRGTPLPLITNIIDIDINQDNNEEFVCYRRLISFDYFNALTTEQMSEYEIPVQAYGQTHMQALIHDGRQKIILYGNILAGLFSYYPPSTIQIIRQLLKSLDQFHFNRNSDKISSRYLDNASVRTLTLLMQYAPPLMACKFYFHNSIRESAECKALREVKQCVQKQTTCHDISKAVRPNIFAQMLELQKSSHVVEN